MSERTAASSARGRGARDNEMRILETGLAVLDIGTLERGYTSARGVDHRVARSDVPLHGPPETWVAGRPPASPPAPGVAPRVARSNVPLHGPPETWIEVRLSACHQAELQRRARIAHAGHV